MKDRWLKNLIKKMITLSFDNQGKIVEENVHKNVQIIQQLPSSKAIRVMKEYLAGLKQGIERTTLKIESALPLSDDEIKKIVRQVQSTDDVYDVQAEVNPSLLGGVRVRIADIVYDDTVGRKILRVKEAIRD